MNAVLVIACLSILLSSNRVNANTQSRDAVACSPDSQPRVLTDPTGSFSSLNYPSNYPDNVDCRWLIIAQPGQVIEVNFEAFNTERRFDIVWFLDGNTTLSPAILGVDGNRNQPPTGIRSSGEVMLVYFTSDALTNAQGFSATYQFIDPAGIQDPCYALSRPLILTSDSGTISSQFFPQPYALQTECQWLFIAQDPDSHIRIEFTEFLTEGNNDWVQVFDGNSQSGQLIARLSGNYGITSLPYESSQQFMFVRFVSDANLSFRGFRANFASVPPS